MEEKRALKYTSAKDERSHIRKTTRSFDPNFPFGVVVTMRVTKEGKTIESRQIDFGKMDEKGYKELNGLFALMSKDIDQIKNMSSVFEKLGKSKPEYVG